MPAIPRGYDALNDYVSDLLDADENKTVSGRIDAPVLPSPQQQEKDDHGASEPVPE